MSNEDYVPPSPSGSWMVISQSDEKGKQTLPQVSVSSQTSTDPILTTTPRSTLSQNHPIPDSPPLQPPMFHPKSKLPRLQYGGLPTPTVQCFRSAPLPTVEGEQKYILLQATAKSLPSPSQFKKVTTSHQSTSHKDETEAQRAREALTAIFFEIGFSSKLFCEIYESEFVEQHLHRIADSLGTGGLTMYIQVWHHWAGWCQCHLSPPAEAPLSLVLDYLHASDHLKRKKDSKPSRTRMMTHIKALRWIASKLDLPVLQYLQSQTVSDFLKSQTRIPFERSEATPIPLAVLAAWEHRILSSESSLAEIITLGCFLIATMASLCFRDLLRTRPDSITVQGFFLRGISGRTKTTVSGQPWGVCCLGVSTRPSKKHWVSRFLEVISIGMERSRQHWGTDWSPDFLLPSWTDSVPFSTPCSYHHALALIRFYSQCNCLPAPLLSPEQAKHLSTHSMKSTLLAQLNLNLEQRAKQGHHKKSVQLYSRHDVWPSLFLQRDILLEISKGWRPLTSQARGAKQPLPEPSFLAPPVSQEDLGLLHMLAPKAPKEPILSSQSDVQSSQQSKAPLEESSSSSESSDSDASDDEDELFSHRPAVLVLNEKSHVIHAARVTNPESTKRSCFMTKNTKFEINCGASVLGSPTKLVEKVPLGAKVCQRKACILAMDTIFK